MEIYSYLAIAALWLVTVLAILALFRGAEEDDDDDDSAVA